MTSYKRTSQRGSWMREKMKLAILEVKGGHTIRAASSKYGVPRSTLQRHVKRNDAEKHLGRQPVFNSKFKKELKEYVLSMESGLTFKELRRLAYRLAEEKGLAGRFNSSEKMAGKKWLHTFLKRNPDIKHKLHPPEATPSGAKGVAQKPTKAESSSNNDGSSVDDENVADAKTVKTPQSKATTPVVQNNAKEQPAAKSSSSEDGDSDEVPSPAKKTTAAAKNTTPVAAAGKKTKESSLSSKSSSEEEKVVPAKTVKTPQGKVVATAPQKNAKTNSSSEEDSSVENSKPAPAKTATKLPAAKAAPVPQKKSKAESSSIDDDSSSDEEVQTKSPQQSAKKGNVAKFVTKAAVKKTAESSVSDDSSHSDDGKNGKPVKGKPCKPAVGKAAAAAKSSSSDPESSNDDKAASVAKKPTVKTTISPPQLSAKTPKKSSSESSDSEDSDDEKSKPAKVATGVKPKKAQKIYVNEESSSCDVLPTNGAQKRKADDHSQPAAKKAKVDGSSAVWTSDEIRQALMPTLTKLYRLEPESLPFRQPVDPVLLGIPKYYDIIKMPIDLSLIKTKLDTGKYKEPWEYVEDVCLMFQNAWVYNRRSSKIYQNCSKLAEVFYAEINPLMKTLGFCCGQKFFYQNVLACNGKQHCIVHVNATYYNYEKRYSYCKECFDNIEGDEVELVDDPNHTITRIHKSKFIKTTNNELKPEQFVECTYCGRRQHKVCALYMKQMWPQPDGFLCAGCVAACNFKRHNKYTAKRLPQTKLGAYLENRVNSFLKRENAGAGEVTIRVLSSSEKVVEVQPGMKACFCMPGLDGSKPQMAESFPYLAKAIFAFQKIDGIDVCFFGMHVQEYGSNCPPPNARHVYLAYMDSVHFFEPRQFRTAVYHEILIGYLNYVKLLGYTMSHIWACPPSEGDDYIFYHHPPDMKIPKPKRLQDWYKEMLHKAVTEGVVLNYNDAYNDVAESNLQSAVEVPYFEGDFWPNILEKIIKELKQKAGQPYPGIKLKNKLRSIMKTHKDAFFAIHLQPKNAQLPPIYDPDPLITNDLMDGRGPFLRMAQENNYEFSTLRLAKFSSLAMLYELHRESFMYTCNACSANMETHYHCVTCDDFDLCISCYKGEQGEQHPHKMEQVGVELDDGAIGTSTSNGNDGVAQNPAEALRQSIQRRVQSLVHAYQCQDANCRLASCQEMKHHIAHTHTCDLKKTGKCLRCKQISAMYCYHAKYCLEANCPFKLCITIKQKIQQWELQQRLVEAQTVQRRMAAMCGGVAATYGARASKRTKPRRTLYQMPKPSPASETA